MANLLMDQIALLMQLGRRAVDLSDCCKGSEPSFGLRFHNDGSISVDFYSYCLTLDSGGRHHLFHATNQAELEKKLGQWIIMAEQENKLVEEGEDLCDNCDGTGSMRGTVDGRTGLRMNCPLCDGTGKKPDND